ncbi:hypothetical protein C8R43DRAFT_883185, partial [Mycena crocata]
ATQKGVQTRDLMNYLAEIKCWAKRHKEQILACQRDQEKGFDHLSPQGILGHHYLNDLMSSDPDALIVTSGRARSADPHLPDDHLKIQISMVEATDDSYIFSRTLPSLQRNVLAMERFQFAYGWLTQWRKSKAFVLEPASDMPDTIELQSTTNVTGVDPLTVTIHKVKLIKNELDFLRAKVDDPHARYEELKNFINDFTFPKFLRRPPITLLRKIVKQNIVSKARALISLQPIKRADAEDLDKRIKAKIHAELGMPFIPSSDVLTLPIDFHGLDFPSIARINDGIAIDGLHPALTGPKTLVLKIEGRNISILHGELVGLIMCLIICHADDAALYSDHLNAVRLIDDSKTRVDQQDRLRGMNGRSYYRWILKLASNNPLKIIYTAGHSSEVSVPSRLNFEADHYASTAQHHLHELFSAPIPTFFMDEFTFYTGDDGWIESNIRNYVDKSMILDAKERIANGHQQRMALALYDPKAPPEYSYTHAYSAYSALIQLYTRSGQLPTADLLYGRHKADDPRCRRGCNAIEDQHHIFVHCAHYAEWRKQAAEDLHRRTNNKLAEKGIEEVDRTGLLFTVKSLFSDVPSVWPLQYSAYYLGHIPKFDHLLPKRTASEDKMIQTQLAHGLAADWHTASIRLAGRIWGNWQKEMARKTDTRGRRT